MMNDKRAQITIFVIISIVIVVGVALIFLFSGILRPEPSPGEVVNPEEQPQESIEQCIELAAQEAADRLIENGGYITKGYFNLTFIYPKGYYKQGIFEDVPYMCYTSRYRTRCLPQEPVLIEHLEDEMEIYLNSTIKSCFDNFKRELERKGYDVRIDEKYDESLKLVPNKVRINIARKIVMSKSGESRTFNEFNSEPSTRLYDMAAVVQEIVAQEARYCNSDYLEIMRYHTWAKITKYVTQDNIRIYTVEDTNTRQQFMFAVRGCVLPVPS